MDWIKKLEDEYGDIPELKTLQNDNYFGKIVLVFESGKITTAHRDQTLKPKSYRKTFKNKNR